MNFMIALEAFVSRQKKVPQKRTMLSCFTSPSEFSLSKEYQYVSPEMHDSLLLFHGASRRDCSLDFKGHLNDDNSRSSDNSNNGSTSGLRSEILSRT